MKNEELNDFLEDLAYFATADEVKDAAERVTTSRPSTKDQALKALRKELVAMHRFRSK
jgi:hypothetical protein